MDLLSLFRKKKSILRPEDVQKLNDLEREAYLEEAKKLVVERGKANAQNQIKIVKDPY